MLKKVIQVERTGVFWMFQLVTELLGRVVDPLGEPVDGVGPIYNFKRYPIERIAPGVCDRQPVLNHYKLELNVLIL